MTQDELEMDGMTLVPDADDMDDETLLKHLDKRHPETGVEKSLSKSVHAREAWVPAYRAWHARQHRIQEYEDHEHEDY